MNHRIQLNANQHRRAHLTVFLALLCAGLASSPAALAAAPDTRNETSQLFYDANGNLTGVHDPLKRTGIHQYDALGRRIKSTPILSGADVTSTPISGGNDAQYGSATYSYDSFNRLTQVTDPRGLVTQYTYDGFGNLLAQYLPDSKTTTNTYDSTGRVTDSIDANGNRTHIDYTEDFTNRPATITYGYDTPNAAVVTLNYYSTVDAPAGSKGKLKEILDPGHRQSTAYTYDRMGRISSVRTATTPKNGGAFTLVTDYNYDNRTGQLLSITYPHLESTTANRRTVNLEHNGPDKSQVSRVTTTYNGQTIPIVTGLGNKPITYRAFGGVLGMALAYGVDASREYDADGRLLSYKLKTSAEATANDTRTLGIDAASRILGYSHASNTTLDQSFAYDDLDRLRSANSASSALGYGYDKNGNRTLKQVGTVPYAPVTASDSNRLRSTPDALPKTYSYDNGKTDSNGYPAGNGNITSDGFFDYQYDVRNRLVAVTTHAGSAKAKSSAGKSAIGTTAAAQPVAQYQYDFHGKRFFKSVTLDGKTTDTYFHYDLGGKLIAETDALGKTTKEYLYFGALPVAFVSYSGETPTLYAVQADHINTPRVMTDAKKNVVWQWLDTDPFGVRQPAGTLTMNLRFPGQYYDAETGLYHNGFRDYNPELGRYMQADPIGLNGGSWSTYAYVNGNPISSVDPDGLEPSVGRGSPEFKVRAQAVLDKIMSITEGCAANMLSGSNVVIRESQDCTATAPRVSIDSGGKRQVGVSMGTRSPTVEINIGYSQYIDGKWVGMERPLIHELCHTSGVNAPACGEKNKGEEDNAVICEDEVSKALGYPYGGPRKKYDLEETATRPESEIKYESPFGPDTKTGSACFNKDANGGWKATLPDFTKSRQ